MVKKLHRYDPIAGGGIFQSLRQLMLSLGNDSWLAKFCTNYSGHVCGAVDQINTMHIPKQANPKKDIVELLQRFKIFVRNTNDSDSIVEFP